MANQVERITKIQVQQSDESFGQPYAVGAEARFVTLSDGTDVQTAISALQLANRKVIKQLGRKGKQLIITRLDGSTAKLDLLWDKNTDLIAGIVDKTGGKVNKGKVWKVGNDGKPGWGEQDKTKTSELEVFKTATSASAGVKGLVPAPAKGQQNKFLRGDAKWVTPAGTVKNTIGQPGYCDATTTASNYYNTFWSVGHVPAGTTANQTNFPGWRNNTVAFIGATGTSAGRAGLVPPPPKGNTTKFLCSDGSWKDAPKGVWVPNLKDQDGYVIAPKNKANVFWGVSKNGTLGWTDFGDVNLYKEGNFFSPNKNRNLLLCGDGSWRDTSSIIGNVSGTQLIMAHSLAVPNRTSTLLPLNNGNWRLLTLSGQNMIGQYMAIANVSVDTRQQPFPLISNNVIKTNSYICQQSLEGYLRAVVNITENNNLQNATLGDGNFGMAPSQNTITRYGGSVTTTYEWYYNGKNTQFIYLIAEYNATRPLYLCYNITIVKIA